MADLVREEETGLMVEVDDAKKLGDALESLVSEKELTFSITVGASLPRVRTDPTHLRKILINLIGNALKFTMAGKVTVRMRQVADSLDQSLRLRFEVEDTGPGIAADELAALFEAFAQTATGLKAQEGTGLGLAISRKFVQLMGGDITVKSQVGQGTTFQFELPCVTISPAKGGLTKSSRRAVAVQAGQSTFRV